MSVLDIFDVPTEKREFAQLPTDNYDVEIESAVIDESGKFGPTLKYILRIISNSNKNQKIWVNRKIEANTLWKIRNDLDALGFHDVSSKNIVDCLEKMFGMKAKVNVSYAKNDKNPAKPWQNVEFIAGDFAPSFQSEDSIPF